MSRVTVPAKRPKGDSRYYTLSRSWSKHLHSQDVVERAETVGNHLIIAGVVLPLPIHQEFIFVPPRGKNDNLGPFPPVVLFHYVLGEIPPVKVPDQNGLFGLRCVQFEGNSSLLCLLRLLLSGHFSPSSVSSLLQFKLATPSDGLSARLFLSPPQSLLCRKTHSAGIDNRNYDKPGSPSK